MIYNLFKKIYLSYFLNFKFIKKFIIKSYNKLNFENDLKSEQINLINKRFEDNNFITAINEDIVKKKISEKKFNNLYILSDLNQEINTKQLNDLNITKINSTENLSEEEINNSLFFLLFSSDQIALSHINKIIKNKGYFKSLEFENYRSTVDHSNATSYRFTNPKCMEAIKKSFLQKKNMSGNYLSTLNTHENICEAIELTKNLPGDYLEIGVFEGGSALTALNYLKQINLSKKVFLLDTFEGFNYKESEKSYDIKWYKSHFIDTEGKTKKLLVNTFKEFNNYKLFTNNICKDELPDEVSKVCLAHIDVDMYEATFAALEKVSMKIVNNGIIMCEDPPNTPLLYGALYAMDEFLKTHEGKKFIKIFKKNHYFLIKKN
tara:strand:+ start:2513 stop:3643 length:1131 start_codon:yes stop_codon:yes gene_type:complete